MPQPYQLHRRRMRSRRRSTEGVSEGRTQAPTTLGASRLGGSHPGTYRCASFTSTPKPVPFPRVDQRLFTSSTGAAQLGQSCQMSVIRALDLGNSIVRMTWLPSGLRRGALSGVARRAPTVEQLGLKVAKPLRQPALLVKRHYLVGAPDAVEDVHVARRGPGWWWRLDASDRGSERHPAEGPRRGDGPERGEEHTPPDPHHRTTSR